MLSLPYGPTLTAKKWPCYPTPGHIPKEKHDPKEYMYHTVHCSTVYNNSNLPAMWGTWVLYLCWEDPLEKGKATHFSILTWRIPWTVYNMRSQRVRHDWVTFTSLTITESWKQPKCPSTEECIKKMWYIYTMEYYSAIKKNEIMPFVAAWMDLESVMLNELSQIEKEKYGMTSLICGI